MTINKYNNYHNTSIQRVNRQDDSKQYTVVVLNTDSIEKTYIMVLLFREHFSISFISYTTPIERAHTV